MTSSAAPSAPRTRRGPVVVALMLAMAMAAIEALIVATAMPTIVGELGGMQLYSWVFSGFLLAQAATIPLYSRFADLFGRKPTFVAGTALFLVGSLLCGLAGSMESLVAFRVLQGIGAGAVMPIATTIVGDLFPLAERAKVQGYLSSVWGVASLVGPVIGGVLVDHVGWPWVFYLNLPVGAAAAVMVALFLHEEIAPRRHRIDWSGSALLVVATVAGMLVLLEGGESIPWAPWGEALLALTLLAGVGFFLQERRAPEPILPLPILSQRLMLVLGLASLTTGALTLGMSSMVPPFVQGVLGTTATVAGLSLGAMSVGWPLASYGSAALLMRRGFYFTAWLGAGATVAAGALLVLLGPGSTPWAVAGISFVMGLGLGLTSTAYIVVVQQRVAWNERGVATGALVFLRQLGSTVGVAVFGALVARRLAAMPELAGLDAEALVDPARRGGLAPEVLKVLTGGYSEALHLAFVGILVSAALGMLLLVGLRGDPLAPEAAGAGSEGETGGAPEAAAEAGEARARPPAAAR